MDRLQQTERRIVGSGDHGYEFIPNRGSFPPDLYNSGVAVDSRELAVDSSGNICMATHTVVNKPVRLKGIQRATPPAPAIYGDAPIA
ncbi:hypothetical protein ACUSIJ_15335 [Pseudochelatococcus sp. B33]